MANSIRILGSFDDDPDALFKGYSDIKIIEDLESKSSTFDIACFENCGKYGIWITISNSIMLINPVGLINSLFKNGDQCEFFIPYNPEQNVTYSFASYKERDCIYTIITNNLTGEKIIGNYLYDEYISKCLIAINNLAEASNANNALAYTTDQLPQETLELCYKQINIKSSHPTLYTCRLRTKDVIQDFLTFKPMNDEWNEQYYIYLGERGYNTWLTHWDSDMEAIRHSLETYTFTKQTVIELPFDTSHTTIKLQRTSTLENVIHYDHGYGFEWKDFIDIEILPNEFINVPILKGLCDEKQAIKALYEGLLRMAVQHPEESCESDTPNRIAAYNRYKSPIIENFLSSDKYNQGNNEYANRQVHVKRIITIRPKYDHFLEDEGATAIDLCDLYDINSQPIIMDDFEMWHQEIRPIIIASETKRDYEKDWNEYHSRGLKLAQQLRKKLSTDFDLWYEAPFEDKSGITPNAMLIF